MKLGTRGSDIIKSYEALKLRAYLPTPDDVWTIGWGHTKGVNPGDVIDLAKAEQFFIEDTFTAVEAVNRLGVPLTQGMFDALVSLVFNTGPGAISPNSTIGMALIKRDYFSAGAGFLLWRKQKGKDLLGLVRRRVKELDIFFQDGIPK